MFKLLKNGISQAVALATQVIKDGGVVALPFDTVYGFACDPRNDKAIRTIFTLKGRDLAKPIGIAIDSIDRLTEIAHTKNIKFIRSHSPGPYTFILPAKQTNLSPLCLKGQTIAVRIPDSKLIRNVAAATGGVITQTSANKAGEPDCGSYQDFIGQFSLDDLDNVDLFIDGGSIPKPHPSQIFDLTGESPHEIDR